MLRLGTEVALLVSGSTLAVMDTFDRYRLHDQRPFPRPPVLPDIPPYPRYDEEDR